MENATIENITNLSFAGINDEFNWIHNTTSGIYMNGDLLTFAPENNTSVFRRGLGTINPVKNRLNVKSNLEINVPTTSTDTTICAVFSLYAGTTLINSYSVYLSSLSPGDSVKYNFDREYITDGFTGALSLRVQFIEGFQNTLGMEYLIVDEYEFQENTVKTYFLIDSIIENSLNAESAVFKLRNLIVDDIETLTQDFINETSNNISKPSDDWFFATADLDGNNRIADNATPNSFNPFVNDLGLDFDDTEYYKGNPISVTSGSDYGTGIFKIGIDKPEILNGVLSPKKGAFFIDFDYSKNFKMVFDVVINENLSNLYDNPDFYRTFAIEWNIDTCEKKYYYTDVNTGAKNVSVLEDGFLYGITGIKTTSIVVSCDESFAPTGGEGFFEYEIDFGTTIGTAGINYNAFSVPDKFEIEWDGNIYTTGYVGSSTYNQTLINAGIPQSEINTANPSNGSGILTFPKDKSFPSKATIRVYGTAGTGWNVTGVCPEETTVSENNVVVEYGDFQNSGGSFVDNIITTQTFKTINIAPVLGTGEVIQLGFSYNINSDDNTNSTRIYYTVNGGSEIIIDSINGINNVSGTTVVNVSEGETVNVFLRNERNASNTGARTFIEFEMISVSKFTGNVSPTLGSETNNSNTIITS